TFTRESMGRSGMVTFTRESMGRSGMVTFPRCYSSGKLRVAFFLFPGGWHALALVVLATAYFIRGMLTAGSKHRRQD
ncbi:MAG: hypothetical protein WCP34_17630, partial [Pseudomonadota bacterium]